MVSGYCFQPALHRRENLTGSPLDALETLFQPLHRSLPVQDVVPAGAHRQPELPSHGVGHRLGLEFLHRLTLPRLKSVGFLVQRGLPTMRRSYTLSPSV